MEPLLYLVHRIPYPPDKGDKIRSYHILRYLAERYRVFLGGFVDIAEDMSHVPRVAGFCADACLRRLHPRAARLRSLPGLLSELPLTLPYYRDPALQGWVNRVIREHGIRKVVVFSSAMAQYVAGEQYRRLRRVIDFVDMDSDKWRQYGENARWPMRWIYRREARTLQRYELQVARDFDHSLFVSRAEVAHFLSHADVPVGHVSTMKNGVDLEYFNPGGNYDNPYPGGCRALIFTGAMDYWANVDAVTWFADEIFPRIRQAVDNAAFYIVGANPVQAVRRLALREGIHVTGRVPDVRPYLAHAALAVAPLRIARGVQNKVLEAMAMGCVVFATPAAAEGLEAQAGHELLVAGDGRTLADGIIEQLRRRGNGDLGRRARTFMEQAYRWEDNLACLTALLDG